MSENNKSDERMPGKWDETDGQDYSKHPREGFTIESEFRDGSERTRDSDGKYKSLTVAITEKYKNLNKITASMISSEFDVSEETAQEHLNHVRKIYGPSANLEGAELQKIQENKAIEEKPYKSDDQEHIY